ncbi:MAG TPA: glycoside hydrolase family 31 protein [Kiritimatiellia bacterium]|nr:glycoside hydrolase family 31 protein [Kiritimatiellia bacterium]HSA18274.1 glycoside hydrolase family 31 protein [Kiritimatiellia bacterium]
MLAPTLVRIEEAGPRGFEDRPTFTVVERDWPGVPVEREIRDDTTLLRAGEVRVEVRRREPKLEDVRIISRDGTLLFDGAASVPAKAFLPEPSASFASWALADQPRLVPPAWGALPPPNDADPASGWNLGNPARDVYVFLPGAGGYRQLVRDLLRLTGPVPLPPLCAFGLIDSRYYPYRQDEALEIIDEYRRRGIPLDIFVLDTDWRVGASHGYEVNRELFPDLPGFIRAAHQRHVRIMLNDHPEPADPRALSPAEIGYRARGLTSLLEQGADFWWFDRNWHTVLGSPAEGLGKETWGMRLYHDIVAAYRPDRRPMIMSNADGIDNGHLNNPPHPAAHRFPIWWTGDTRASWADLERAVRNAVRSGTLSLLPFLSDDLGGHHDTPDPELYVRFVQYGTLSPVCRLHCSYKLHRFPWMFGEPAGTIASEYIRLRYRLLPTLYAAARQASAEGTPMLRRGDLEWPGHAEAASDTQYLLGPDLLVAPILRAATPLAPIPTEFLRGADGTPGLQAEYFGNDRLAGEPAARLVEPLLNHGWFGRPPAPGMEGRGFSARWTGTLGPVPEDGKYRIGVRTDDGVRLWLDDRLLLDEFEQSGEVYKWRDVDLKAGQRCALRVEYRNLGTWHAMFELLWGRPNGPDSPRPVWVPPGMWMDPWTGARIEGPAEQAIPAALHQVPMLIRGGGILFSTPLRLHTGTALWPEIRADLAWYPGDFDTRRELYEDDGFSIAYRQGAGRVTPLRFRRARGTVEIEVEPAAGGLADAGGRRWLFRVHGLTTRPADVHVHDATLLAVAWGAGAGLLPFEASASWARAARPVLEIDVEQSRAGTPVRVEFRA